MSTPNKYHPNGALYGHAFQRGKSQASMLYQGYGPDVVWRHVHGVLMPFIQTPDFRLISVEVIQPLMMGRNRTKRQRREFTLMLARRLRRG